MQLFIYKMQQLKNIKCSINLQRHVVATTVTKKSMSVASELSRPKMFVSFLMSFVILAFLFPSECHKWSAAPFACVVCMCRLHVSFACAVCMCRLHVSFACVVCMCRGNALTFFKNAALVASQWKRREAFSCIVGTLTL